MSTEVQELQGFTQTEAERLISRRVCAQCWSELIIVNDDGQRMVNVICPGCTESVEVTGHVSVNTPGILMENGKYAYREVKRNLRDLFPETSNGEKRTIEQNIKDLGF